ncbi:MAG TPA: beta-L-arabinofuranosidase domain-containing protein, partial [Gemmataceae bacterium]|nr:beta-L-arabinofuranosidase domain-containing protein [Gemmataceae bacterium]
MSAIRILLALGLPVCLFAGDAAADEPQHLTPVPFPQVHIDDTFWNPRLRANQTATIAANLRQCEITGRLKNFASAAKQAEGKHQGFLFNDSDVYKVIEGIAYSLTVKRDPELEKRVDAVIDQIAAAQQPDGYLNTYFTVVKPEERWKGLAHSHELYCAGHLIEAGVAYYQATGKDKLLNVAKKFTDYIISVFGPGKRIETSGHEEIELALIKLYHLTNEQKYLDQARFFLEVRGRAEQRKLFGEYAQDHKPIREQDEVTGHAVRAMYLYCAIADLAAIGGDKQLMANLEKIWKDVTERRMYITGGIGSSASNEGFTVPYDLPNDAAYCETCAAVGMALWNHRMFLMTGDGKYADVLERAVYNGLLSGVSLSGDRFFYTNPLASTGKHQRAEWFDCACCPTNVVRYVPGIGERMYATRDNQIYTVLYAANTSDVTVPSGKVKIKQDTHYPWEENILLRLEPEMPATFGLNLRIPGWCKEFAVLVNGEKHTAESKNGFVRIEREWKKGDVVELKLAMPVQRVHADPNVKADVGRVALQRGPLVYCLEGIGNNGSVRSLVLPPDSKLTTSWEKDTLGGVVVICGQALS